MIIIKQIFTENSETISIVFSLIFLFSFLLSGSSLWLCTLVCFNSVLVQFSSTLTFCIIIDETKKWVRCWFFLPVSCVNEWKFVVLMLISFASGRDQVFISRMKNLQSSWTSMTMVAPSDLRLRCFFNFLPFCL